MSRKGTRKYLCADCGTAAMLHWVELARRCKPRCQKCGSTFFNPYSEGACEMEINAGTARAISDSKPPNIETTKEAAMMRGEQEIPRRRAFTVSELLCVVCIVGILLAVVLPGLRNAREEARNTRCLAGLGQIATMAHQYRDINRVYPRAPWGWDALEIPEGREPRRCPKDRRTTEADSHGLWSEAFGALPPRLRFEAWVDQYRPPGPLVSSDLGVWTAEPNGIWRDGGARRIAR